MLRARALLDVDALCFCLGLRVMWTMVFIERVYLVCVCLGIGVCLLCACARLFVEAYDENCYLRDATLVTGR